MTASRIAYLFNRYINHTCTTQEKAELMARVREPANEALLKSLIKEVIENTGSETELPVEKAHSILTGIVQSGNAAIIPLKNQKPFFVPWMRVAAAVLFVVIAGAIYWLLPPSNRNKKARNAVAMPKPEPILPGRDQALLTMADGRTVILDSIQNGMLIQPGNAHIQKQRAVLMYNTSSENVTAGVAFNTLSTPRGGQYRVVLSDGSQVWLNAASSLRFPTLFAGNTRDVELTGEAYFEIAKNKSKPFQVTVNGMQVHVLGTHFNINAYAEEQAIKTSLLEGSVQVSNGSVTSKLKPGEQATVLGEKEGINISTADMDAVVAWKNGLFEFEGADISAIMRQVARWYDVEIVNTGNLPSRRFEGKISRNAQLSDVLQILELSAIKFKVEGKKIIVQ